jgi:hypothetical protein
MSDPLVVSVPHSLGKAEALRRLKSGFARMTPTKPGHDGVVARRPEAAEQPERMAVAAPRVMGMKRLDIVISP